MFPLLKIPHAARNSIPSAKTKVEPAKLKSVVITANLLALFGSLNATALRGTKK